MTSTLNTNCPVFNIPALCDAAIITSGASVSTPGAEPYYAVAYPIAALATDLRGYDPSNNALQAYEFTVADVMMRWEPFIYQISGGIILSTISGRVVSESVSSTGLTCASNFNTNLDEYTLVSWYRTAEQAAANAQTVI